MSRRFWAGLLAITALALVWRLLLVFTIHPDCGLDGHPPPDRCVAILGGNSDPRYLHDVANLVADGDFFVDPIVLRVTGEELPTAHKMPLFPTVLAASSVVGATSVDAHRALAAAMGAGAVVAIGLVARQLAGPRSGLLGAAAAAVYPGLWINDYLLQVESLYAVLVAASIGVAYRFWWTPTVRWAGILGVVIALGVMTRAETVLLYAFMVVPLLLGMDLSWRRRFELAAVCGALGLVVMGPWVAWNLVRFEERTLFSIAPGNVLNAATCDQTYYGDYIGYAATCLDYSEVAREVGVPEDELGDYFLSIDESERSAIAGEQANEYLRDHIERLPLVMAARVGRLWEVYKPVQNTRLNSEIEARGHRASQAALVAWYGVVVLGVGGLVVLRRRGLPISPFLSIAVAITLTAAWAYGNARYRVPIDVAALIASAVAVDAGLQRWWRADAD